MAHFAQIENGIVTQVIVVANELCAGGNFPESEPAGQAFIASLGIAGEWKQTSYNTEYVYETVLAESDDPTELPTLVSATVVGSINKAGGTPFRGTYAGIGYIYDAVTDTFTPPVVEDAPE